MRPTSLLAELGLQGMEVGLDGENLRCRASKGAITPRLRQSLSDHKLALLQLLRHLAGAWPQLLVGETRPPELCLHWLVELHAERTPDADAVIHSGGRLSYRELNRMAEDQAHRLRAEGVGPEVIVRLSFDHSPSAVVALLATLKAGAVCAPDDSDTPRTTDIPVHPSRTSDGACGANLAFLLATSGASGNRKWIEVEHRSLARQVTAVVRQLSIQPAVGTLLTASPFTQLGLMQLWLSLTSGGSVHLPAGGYPNTAKLLAECHADSKANVVVETPSRLRKLRSSGWQPASGACLVSTGEPLDGGLARYFVDAGVRLVNLYGSLETSLATSLDQQPDDDRDNSLGTPVVGTDVHVLDAAESPVELGVYGELCVRGDPLARGYHAAADWTADVFRPSPLAHRPGERCARTGDVGRWRPDGSLELLDRGDQLGRRGGYRVHPLPAASALLQLPQVGEAAVLLMKATKNRTEDSSPQPLSAAEGKTGLGFDRVMVAFVAPREGHAEQDPQSLRKCLSRHVPPPLMPAEMIIVDELPLGPDGKVDRLALVDRRAVAAARSSIARRRPDSDDDIDELCERTNLTKNQLLVWMGQMLHPDIPLYNIATVLTVFGQVDRAAFERAVETLINGSDALRTVIDVVDGIPQQRVVDRRSGYLSYLDLSHCQDPRGTLMAWATEQGRRVFDLSNRLFDTAFIKLSDGEYAWYLNQHHLITDGWSVALAYQRVAELYSRFLAGEAADVADTPPFADFVALEREKRQSDAYQRAKEYWQRKLAVEFEPHRFYGTSSGKMKSLRVDRVTHELGVERSERIRAEAAKHDLENLYTFNLFAAFLLTYLYRIRGHRNLAIATPLLNRPSKQFKATLGLFMHAVPLRFSISPDETFPTLIEKVGAEVRETMRYQRYATANPPHRPAYDVWLNYEFINLSDFAGMSGRNDTIYKGFADDSLAILVRNYGTSSGFSLDFDFRCDLFNEAQRNQTFGHFLQIVDSYLDDPNRHLDEVELLTPDEWRRVVLDFNQTLGRSPSIDVERPPSAVEEHSPVEPVRHGTRPVRRGCPDPTVPTTVARSGDRPQLGGDRPQLGDRPIETDGASILRDQPQRDIAITQQCESGVDMWETRVELAPDRIAVVAGDRQLTYGELNRRANQLASFLVGLGAGPEVPIGICIHRTLEMLVGVLGILKAGSGYVPLDPSYPVDRLSAMLARVPVKVMLSQASLRQKLTLPGFNGRVCCLDAQWDEIALGSSGSNNPDRRHGGDCLAYVIFTSGSTGSPNAVQVAQRNLAHYASYAAEAFQLQPDDGVLQFASLVFDASAEEIFSCLIAGSRLVLRSETMIESTVEFLQCCQRWGVTVLDLPTAYWHQLVSDMAATASSFSGAMRLMIIGGERASGDALKQWRGLDTSQLRLLNTYGPTEATIVATTMDLTASSSAATDGDRETVVSPPIGAPIRNVRTYVLDPQLRPLPLGITAQLFIGGAGITRGYAGNPAATASKFVPDPFSAQPGTRLYATGDLCRWSTEGQLDFVGRADHQVKLRGFRLELGDIEAALCRHPCVAQAIVVARPPREAVARSGDRPQHEGDRPPAATEARLVAYIVASDQPGNEFELADVRAFLRSQLPEYMTPTSFIRLDALPLTPSGKVDRRALPMDDGILPELSTTYAPPTTPIEQKLAHIWSELLGIERVGIQDNFFELGGHSLLATQVHSRVRREFPQAISLQKFFDRPTIAGLAEAIQEATTEAAAPVISRVPRNRRLPLSYAQSRLWFLEQVALGKSPIFNVPMAVRVGGPLRIAVFMRSINEIIRRHETLRTLLATVDGDPQQVVLPEFKLHIPLLDLTGVGEQDRQFHESVQLARQEAGRPFDLSQLPLFRVQILRLDVEDHVVLVTLHHVISDGWSRAIIMRELAALYDAFCTDRPSPLAELTIQYADFAVWQRSWLDGQILEQQLAYWRQQLEGLRPLELPTDRPRPLRPSLRGASQTIVFSETLSADLRAFADQQHATLFMVLLAAFQTLLARETKQLDVAVITDIANRNRVETEGLIGFFVNQLVLRTNLAGDPSFVEHVQRVRQATLGAYAHQDLPYDKLIEELQPKRRSALSPWIPVKFEFQQLPPLDSTIDELSFALLPFDFVMAKEDLHLSVRVADHRLAAAVTYAVDLFDEVTIRRLMASFETILVQALKNPTLQLTEVHKLVDTEERARQRQTAEIFEESGLRLLQEVRSKRVRGRR